MIESFIKYIFILLITFYFFVRLLNIKISFSKYVFNIFFSVYLCSIVYVARIYVPHITILILLITSCIQTSLAFNMSIKTTLITSIFSLGLSYFTYAISTILVAPFSTLSVLTKIPINILYIILYVIAGILQCFIAVAIFRIRKLQKGMPFLLQKVPVHIGIFIGCFILVITTLLTILQKNASLYSFVIIICITATFILFIWWRKQLSITYINKAHKNEVKRIQSELEALRQDNERLGAIIHKDNKLIPAMIMSVQHALSSYCSSDEIADIELTKLLTELEKLSVQRSILTSKQLESPCSIPLSNITRLDMMLKFMYKKADEFHINLTVDFHSEVCNMLTKFFTEDSLVTILADLIDNAIIATKLSFDQKEIYIDFTKENDNYRIDVYDSGIPFEPYTIQNAGIKKASTHLDTGGSGIGLMTIFTLLRECGGSFVIDEIIKIKPYRKKVSIVLDSLSQFRVNSYRAEILNTAKSNPNIIFNS